MVYHEPTNSVFLFGGMNRYGWDVEMMPDVWKFDVAKRTWTYVTSFRPRVYVDGAGNSHQVPVMAPVLDTESDRIIFFNRAQKTWAFDPVTYKWEKMAPDPYNVPPRRCGARMVYDSESDRVIMVMGFECISAISAVYDDVWAYDYNSDTWEEMHPDTVPPARMYFCAVYDPVLDRSVMWGGRLLHEFYDDTVWYYDYNQDAWSPVTAKGGPGEPYSYSGMIYHPQNQEMFMYGGVHIDDAYPPYTKDETWIYQPADSSWTQITPTNGPGKVSVHAMAYLGSTDEILLFGGEAGEVEYEGTFLEGTWIMDYPTLTWREQLFGFAGNDNLLCQEDLEGLVLGGTPTAWGGTEPYTYSWSAEGYEGGAPLTGSELLDDVSAANPALNAPVDSADFFLEVTSQDGQVVRDSLSYLVSSLSVCSDVWETEFFRGDSVQLDHCVEGGMGPVSYVWSPGEYLSDTAASRPWASTDSLSVTFDLVATDTIGCQVHAQYSLVYSTVGIEDREITPSWLDVRVLYEGGHSSLQVTNSLQEGVTMQILGMDGRLMETVPVEPGTVRFSLSRHMPGIYVYRILGEPGIMGSGKFLVK